MAARRRRTDRLSAGAQPQLSLTDRPLHAWPLADPQVGLGPVPRRPRPLRLPHQHNQDLRLLPASASNS